MKRLISAALVLTLLGATAASAQGYRGGYGGYGHGGYGHGGYSRGYGHGGGWRGRDDGALLGLGVGLFALGAIAAASSQDRYEDRYYDRYDYGPPPPPAYCGRYGYGY